MLFAGPEEPLMASWRWWRGGRTPPSMERQLGPLKFGSLCGIHRSSTPSSRAA